jgi:hypothetical protein
MTLLAPAAPSAFVNRRRFERFSLRPMYTAVSLRRRSDDASSRLDGHAYDIGEGGVNVEIDEPIVAGEPIELEIDLPGCSRRIAALGRVVRCEDDPADVLGPCRLAVKFEGFASDLDLPALRRYLGEGWLMRAA